MDAVARGAREAVRRRENGGEGDELNVVDTRPRGMREEG